MKTQLAIISLTLSLVHAQLNGEFWWLNSKLNNYRNVQPPEPEIEVLDDNETDESAKIVFRDDPVETSRYFVNKFDNSVPRWHRQVVWPDDRVDSTNRNQKEMIVSQPIKNEDNEDEFNLSIPILDTNVTAANNATSTESTMVKTTKKPHNVNSEIIFSNDIILINNVNDKESQSICTYMTKAECKNSKGIIYDFSMKRQKNISEDLRKICCILPLIPKASEEESNEIATIFFPDRVREAKMRLRNKREIKKLMSQRDFLLLHRAQSQKKPTSPTRIVNPSDEEVDPYWNIKNSNFQNKKKEENTQNDYFSEDYSDYEVELPKPGLVGIYSDHTKPANWAFSDNKGFGYGGNDDYSEEEEEEVGFGYSTIDPRKGEHSHKQTHKVRPTKLSTSSGEISVNAETQTINFQSNPDFQVLQGFKLLNLIRNQSRVVTKNIRRTSTERYKDSDEQVLVSEPDDSDDEKEYFEEDQLFGDCGKSVAIRNSGDKQTGDASNGSHPWLAFVVLSKRKQNVLCYATLIHPRAAITVADCVEGSAPKDITVIAGLWDLNQRSQAKSRVATIHVHPRYRPGNLDHNLAILYWMRPLTLGVNIQPACVGDFHPDEQCSFYGWGSLNTGIQPRSKWQKASIKPCNVGGVSKTSAVSEIFCATAARNTVTGLGGPLICNADGRGTVVGIVVGKEQKYVLIPARGFAMKTVELINRD